MIDILRNWTLNIFMDTANERAISSTTEQIRNQARESLFALSSSLGSTMGDRQLVDKLGRYLEAEVNFNKSKSRAASPRFDLEADKNELHFNNALNFLKTDGRVGRDAMEDVLLRINDEELEKTNRANDNRQLRLKSGQDEAARRLREVVLDDQLRNRKLGNITDLNKAA